MAFSPGTRLGPYEFSARIGAGGMGEVYRARDTKLDRDVAIKVLPEAFAADPERLARFEREAKTLAALNHPNIAAIYGVEDTDGTRALVMELVEGPTLADRIAQGPVPVDEALPVAKQIAEALEAAHEQAIVHRDLKPANVKLRPDGTVKVLDFGLAKALGPDVAGGMASSLSMSPTITTPAMTRAGVVMGTAAYMSPEQTRGKPVDKRADIWAFGCVVCELLTGRRVFGGDEVADTMVAVLTHEPEWGALPPDLPAPVASLLRRCLVKDPRKRLRDVGEARLVLEGLSAGPSASGGPGGLEGTVSDAHGTPSGSMAPRSVRRLTTWVAAGAIAGAVIALVLRAWLQPVTGALAFRATILPPAETTEAGAFGAQTFALSPDGRWLALVRVDSDGLRRLWVRSLDDLSARVLRGTEGAIAPFWSPDSRSVAFAVDGQIERVDLTGDLPLMICPFEGQALGFSAGTWGPDGTVLFSTIGSRGIFRVPAAGGRPVQVTHVDQERGELNHSQVSFLPDGRHFLYYAGGQGDPLGLYVASLDSPERVLVLERGSRARFSSGQLFFTREQELVAQPFDLERFTLQGEAVKVADAVDVGGALQSSGAFSVSTDGVLVYEELGVESRARLEWLDRAGRRLGTPGDAGSYSGPVLSPDGSLTAVEIGNESLGNPGDLWVLDNVRGDRRRLTSSAAMEIAPVWSPDGKRLAFTLAQPTAGGPLLRVKSLAAGEDAPLAEGQFFGFPTSWSTDGRFLLITGFPSQDIWVLPAGGDQEPTKYRATPFDEAGGVFSPDGKWVAYSSNESGRDEIYVARFPDPGNPQRVTSEGGVWPQWRSDGHELFYLSLDRQLVAVDVDSRSSRLEFGRPHALFQTRTPTPENRLMAMQKPYSAAPDGRRFLVAVSMGDASPGPLTLLVRRW